MCGTTSAMVVLVLECSEFRLDGKALFALLYMSDNLCVDVEAAAYIDNRLCHLGRNINLHAVTHVEHLVHLFPVGAAFFLMTGA